MGGAEEDGGGVADGFALGGALADGVAAPVLCLIASCSMAGTVTDVVGVAAIGVAISVVAFDVAVGCSRCEVTSSGVLVEVGGAEVGGEVVCVAERHATKLTTATTGIAANANHRIVRDGGCGGGVLASAVFTPGDVTNGGVDMLLGGFDEMGFGVAPLVGGAVGLSPGGTKSDRSGELYLGIVSVSDTVTRSSSPVKGASAAASSRAV